MGPTDSPVANGYRKVTRFDAYNSDRGYGWEKTPDADYSREKNWPGELPYWHDHPGNCLWTHSIAMVVAGEEPMIFRVDVPNGRYVVRARIGDYIKPAMRQNLFANNMVIVERLDAGLGGIWGQILQAAVTPVRGVVDVTDGMLRLTFSVAPPPGYYQSRVAGIHLRRCEPSPVRLDGIRLIWRDSANGDCRAICELINTGDVIEARQGIDAMPEKGQERYHKACFLEALAGSMEFTEPDDCLEIIKAAESLLQKPIAEVDDATRKERLQSLKEFRVAYRKVRLMGYVRADQETKTNQFRRLQTARVLAAQIQPDEL